MPLMDAPWRRCSLGVGMLALGASMSCGRTDMISVLSDSAGSDDSSGETGSSSDGTTSQDSTGDVTTTGVTTRTDTSTDTIDPSTTGPIPIECGNGILEPGEECDPGIEDIGPTEACVPGCQLNLCGDGMPGPAEDCDDGNVDPTDACSNACTASSCGDGVVWLGVEECDDADDDDDDACHDDCTQTRIVQIALGGNHSCVRLDNGAVRCWGNGNNGRSGQGSLENFGDDEPASAGIAAQLDSPASEIVTGLSHTCVRNDGGQVRCFGRARDGQLGYGILEDIGDDEPAGAGGPLSIGDPVASLALRGGSFHTCAVTQGGAIRCWGLAGDGRLGIPGLSGSIGDDELPSSIPPVDVGGFVVQATTGGSHTCALLDTGQLRCWGSNASGQLGYGVPGNIGDDELPSEAGPVPIGIPVQHVTAGFHHTCALADTGDVYCWGRGNDGRLGYGNTAWIGLGETPASVGPVSLGGPAQQLEAGNAHTCALLVNGTVRCWGWGGQGQLGYGTLENIGDDELPSAAGSVPVGGLVLQIAADGNHTCALLESGPVRCWGNGGDGRLGYGDTETIGDDEFPLEVGEVPILP